MKRMACILLTLVLALGMAGSASAATKYDSVLLKDVDISLTTIPVGSEYRSAIAASLLIDYLLVSGTDSSTFLSNMSYSSSTRIAVFGSSIDVYYPRTDGRYYNLFYSPYSHTISDYGVTSGPSSTSSYTYYYVSATDLMASMSEILEILSN